MLQMRRTARTEAATRVPVLEHRLSSVEPEQLEQRPGKDEEAAECREHHQQQQQHQAQQATSKSWGPHFRQRDRPRPAGALVARTSRVTQQLFPRRGMRRAAAARRQPPLASGGRAALPIGSLVRWGGWAAGRPRRRRPPSFRPGHRCRWRTDRRGRGNRRCGAAERLAEARTALGTGGRVKPPARIVVGAVVTDAGLVASLALAWRATGRTAVRAAQHHRAHDAAPPA